MNTPALTRPALRYHGGKFRLAPWIIGHFPPHVCYVEPFAGAASVLLRKPPSTLEVYNDVDGAVVGFFRVLRERTDELLRSLALTPYSRSEVTLAFEPCDDDLEAARRFYIRSWQSRGGPRGQWKTGWRYQKRDNRGGQCVGDWSNTDHLTTIVERLRSVQFECDDAETVIRRFDAPDTLFYCDPPYLAATRSDSWGRRGYAHELSDDDHRRLADVLHGIRGMALVSGYPSPLYDELYGDWRVATCRSQTDGPIKTERTECLWLSPAAAARARQQPLMEALP
jgi:DNA adenine methylase